MRTLAAPCSGAYADCMHDLNYYWLTMSDHIFHTYWYRVIFKKRLKYIQHINNILTDFINNISIFLLKLYFFKKFLFSFFIIPERKYILTIDSKNINKNNNITTLILHEKSWLQYLLNFIFYSLLTVLMKYIINSLIIN